jgi:hypothetical protein
MNSFTRHGFLAVTTFAVAALRTPPEAATPSAALLAECRKVTADARELASITEEQQPYPEDSPLFVWPPQIRYALFYETHYQISSRICDAAQRGDFINPTHVLRFNVRFIQLSVKESSALDEEIRDTPWGRAREVCAAKGFANKWIGIDRCAFAMAQAHIDGDMPKVLNAVGCGSNRDWEYLFQSIIKPSVTDATRYIATTTGKAWLSAAPTADAFSAFLVKTWRNRVRERADCAE